MKRGNRVDRLIDRSWEWTRVFYFVAGVFFLYDAIFDFPVGNEYGVLAAALIAIIVTIYNVRIEEDVA